jgi:sulfoxide reductase heme-binding subunit YedZ
VSWRWFYASVFAACALPGVLLARQAAPVLIPAFFPDVVLPWAGDLGANPVETLLHSTGRYAFFVLIGALAVTPVRRLTGWNRVQGVRRMVGLWSFTYAALHFTTYVAFDKVGDLREIVADVLERRFIFSGMLALSILTVLAATSSKWSVRLLGKRWQRLHRLVYLGGVAAVVHFVWGQKAAIGEPLLWASVLSGLFAVRAYYALRKRTARRQSAVSS